MMDNRTILQGDALEKLKEIPDESIDLICTDPPYGYSFMNKNWDKAVITVPVWAECLRVLKPGSWAFIMSAPRQDVLSHMIVNLSEAGFKTDFTSIYWAYASGFPKAMNISKAIDKKLGVKPIEIKPSQGVGFMNPEDDGYNKTNNQIIMPKAETPQAKALDGSYAGYQPKPAVEVVLVVMKPLSEKNYVEQAMNNGKGVTWLDDVRVPYRNENDIESASVRHVGKQKFNGKDYNNGNPSPELLSTQEINNQGRFPANLLVSDDSLDIGKKTKPTGRPNCIGKKYNGVNDGDKSVYGDFDKRNLELNYQDFGDFSRYYSLDAWEAQFIVTPKPSKSEKNKGLDSFLGKTVNDGRDTEMDTPFQRGETIRQNVHPTVKPVSLFKYLITMGSRPNDMVLDPFMGSGTTAIACEKTARNWAGIELNEEYIQIIQKRLDPYRNERLDASA